MLSSCKKSDRHSVQRVFILPSILSEHLSFFLFPHFFRMSTPFPQRCFSQKWPVLAAEYHSSINVGYQNSLVWKYPPKNCWNLLAFAYTQPFNNKRRANFNPIGAIFQSKLFRYPPSFVLFFCCLQILYYSNCLSIPNLKNTETITNYFEILMLAWLATWVV